MARVPFPRPTYYLAIRLHMYVYTPSSFCSADITVTGLTSAVEAKEANPGAKTYSSFTLKRRAALRPSAPALSLAVEACPGDVVLWNPGPERAAAIADLGKWRRACAVCWLGRRISAGSHGARPLFYSALPTCSCAAVRPAIVSCRSLACPLHMNTTRWPAPCILKLPSCFKLRPSRLYQAAVLTCTWLTVLMLNGT